LRGVAVAVPAVARHGAVMDQITHGDLGTPRFSAREITQYRRDGYVVARGIMGPRSVAACTAALSDLATGRLAARETVLMYEAGHDPATIAPEQREGAIRKYMDFVRDAPALEMAAMNRRLHALLDQLLGEGRVLFQEMALVKPPHIGTEKPWHQDAAYFRLTDPGLIVGVWIALDPALRENGCMELVPGSHLHGAMPHQHENDFNRCRIVPQHVRAAERIAIEMQPGDALIFHSLLHHYTAPNASPLRRRRCSSTTTRSARCGVTWRRISVCSGLPMAATPAARCRMRPHRTSGRRVSRSA
jgi:phytanoyl-CoA hydroxylase